MTDMCSNVCFLPLYITWSNILKPNLGFLNYDHVDLWSNTSVIYTNKMYSKNNLSVRRYSSASGVSKSEEKKTEKTSAETKKEMGSNENDGQHKHFPMNELMKYWETDRRQRTELEQLAEMQNDWEKYDDEHNLSEENMKYWESSRKKRCQRETIVEDAETLNRNVQAKELSVKEKLQQQLIVEDSDLTNGGGHVGHLFSVERYWKSAGPDTIKYDVSEPNSEASINSYGDKTEPCLTHTDEQGKADMVDIGSKGDTQRVAEAQGIIFLGEKAFSLVKDNKMKKGDVFSVSQIAGIMGAKKTAELIPLCHNINLSKIDVSFTLHEEDYSVVITATVKTYDKTGVEMEALTAVSLAALTVYDMCKAVTRDMVISDVKLILKTGGQRGDYSLHGKKTS